MHETPQVKQPGPLASHIECYIAYQITLEVTLKASAGSVPGVMNGRKVYRDREIPALVWKAMHTREDGLKPQRRPGLLYTCSVGDNWLSEPLFPGPRAMFYCCHALRSSRKASHGGIAVITARLLVFRTA